jgi:hypothetical protein
LRPSDRGGDWQTSRSGGRDAEGGNDGAEHCGDRGEVNEMEIAIGMRGRQLTETGMATRSISFQADRRFGRDGPDLFRTLDKSAGKC